MFIFVEIYKNVELTESWNRILMFTGSPQTDRSVKFYVNLWHSNWQPGSSQLTTQFIVIQGNKASTIIRVNIFFPIEMKHQRESLSWWKYPSAGSNLCSESCALGERRDLPLARKVWRIPAGVVGGQTGEWKMLVYFKIICFIMYSVTVWTGCLSLSWLAAGADDGDEI